MLLEIYVISSLANSCRHDDPGRRSHSAGIYVPNQDVYSYLCMQFRRITKLLPGNRL